MVSKNRWASVAAGLIGATGAFFLWATLPSGVFEPWDDEGMYSIAVLFLTGICGGFLLPFRGVAVWLGAIAGLVAYPLFFTRNGLLLFSPLGVVALALSAAWAAIAGGGALAASWARTGLR